MKFGWSARKQAINIAKHNVDFVDVLAGFSDPSRNIKEDKRHDYGEVRYNMLTDIDGRIYHVTFTARGDLVWLISARKANKREQRRYGQE
jgi:uncharacterized DUF497 family protein